MPYSTLGKNAMLDALGDLSVFASLHEGDPGDNGTNEISGGAPAYARKAFTWSPAVAGSKDSSIQPVFDIPAGKTVAYVGFWSALSGGVFYGASALVNEVFAAQGTYTLLDMDIGILDA
ncbi:hypothetical protein ES707_00338 [subsurface metagenome]